MYLVLCFCLANYTLYHSLTHEGQVNQIMLYGEGAPLIFILFYCLVFDVIAAPEIHNLSLSVNCVTIMVHEIQPGE